MRLDLAEEKRIKVCPLGGYHQRLLDVVASIIFGRQKEAVRTLAQEFYLLVNVDELVTRYSNALASVALDKVKRDAQTKADQDRTAEHLSWDDLVLPLDTKEDLRTYCEILRRHDYYREQGIHVPKGLLLVGPPGTGKTQTARVLSREAGFKFISCSTSDLKVGWIGHAAAKVKEVFSQARSQEPALIFLDELDAICPPRGLYHDCISQELTAELLTEMDGVSSNGQAVFTVAATNRLDMIDSALLSRFTEHLQIGLPNSQERMQLLRLFIGQTPLNGPKGPKGPSGPPNRESVDGSAAQREPSGPGGPQDPQGPTRIEILARLALASENKSGRDLKNLVDKARMRALKRSIKNGDHGSVTLTEEDFV